MKICKFICFSFGHKIDMNIYYEHRALSSGELLLREHF